MIAQRRLTNPWFIAVLMAVLLALAGGCGNGASSVDIRTLSDISGKVKAEYEARDVTVGADEGLFGSSLTVEVINSELNDLSTAEQEAAAREVALLAREELEDPDQVGEYEVTLYYRERASEDEQVATFALPADELR